VKITETNLPGVFVVEPRVFADDRGFFYELYNAERFAEHAAQGLPSKFRQDNHSRSSAGVLRGLHYQLHRPQGKLVTCIRGSVFDVAVDIRIGSPTFGRWTGVVLTDGAPRSLWVPPGFAHGFCATSPLADVIYKCTDVYDAADDRGVLWSDPSIGIPWPVAAPITSGKDRTYALLDPNRSDLPIYAP
jgi:dTDP-4-dehydrorhamnose 3,5-epimerase